MRNSRDHSIDTAHWRAPNGFAEEGSRWRFSRGNGGCRDIAGGLAVPVSGRSQRYPIVAVAVLFQLKSAARQCHRACDLFSTIDLNFFNRVVFLAFSCLICGSLLALVWVFAALTRSVG